MLEVHGHEEVATISTQNGCTLKYTMNVSGGKKLAQYKTDTEQPGQQVR